MVGMDRESFVPKGREGVDYEGSNAHPSNVEGCGTPQTRGLKAVPPANFSKRSYSRSMLPPFVSQNSRWQKRATHVSGNKHYLCGALTCALSCSGILPALDSQPPTLRQAEDRERSRCGSAFLRGAESLRLAVRLYREFRSDIERTPSLHRFG